MDSLRLGAATAAAAAAATLAGGFHSFSCRSFLALVITCVCKRKIDINMSQTTTKLPRIYFSHQLITKRVAHHQYHVDLYYY